jgi:hypothetical protein
MKALAENGVQIHPAHAAASIIQMTLATDAPPALQAQAEEFLRQSGVRDAVLRHEGQPNEQRFSHILACFAANAIHKPE